MELTRQVHDMAHYVAFAASRRSSLDVDDVEQECLLLAWQAKDNTPPALLRRMMNDRATDLMRSAARRSKVRYVSNEVLDKRCTTGSEGEVCARDFADAFDATLTPTMRETRAAIRDTSTLEEAAKLCGVSGGTMRSRKLTLRERFEDFISNS